MKRTDPVDDGRTIADMNIDGMPWYNARLKKQPLSPAANSESAQGKNKAEKIKLTVKERAAIIKAALWVVLPIIAFFSIGYFAVMLFIQFLWLR